MDELIIKALSGELGEDQRRMAQMGVKWVDTLLRKNLDYGSTIFQTPRLAPECDPGTAIRVRMSDKIDRLTNLMKREHEENYDNKPHVTEETIEDTLSDLGAYCLLYLTRPREKEPTEVPKKNEWADIPVQETKVVGIRWRDCGCAMDDTCTVCNNTRKVPVRN